MKINKFFDKFALIQIEAIKNKVKELPMKRQEIIQVVKENIDEIKKFRVFL